MREVVIDVIQECYDSDEKTVNGYAEFPREAGSDHEIRVAVRVSDLVEVGGRGESSVAISYRVEGLREEATLELPVVGRVKGPSGGSG